MNKGRTQTNGPVDKKVDSYALLQPRDDIDRLYVLKKKEEEDSPILNIAWRHQYEDLNDYIKEQRKTNYSDLWEHWKHKDKHKNKN